MRQLTEAQIAERRHREQKVSDGLARLKEEGKVCPHVGVRDNGLKDRWSAGLQATCHFEGICRYQHRGMIDPEAKRDCGCLGFRWTDPSKYDTEDAAISILRSRTWPKVTPTEPQELPGRDELIEYAAEHLLDRYAPQFKDVCAQIGYEQAIKHVRTEMVQHQSGSCGPGLPSLQVRGGRVQITNVGRPIGGTPDVDITLDDFLARMLPDPFSLKQLTLF